MSPGLVRSVAGLFFALLVGGPGCRGPADAEGSPQASTTTDFASDWPTGLQRTWIGPGFWANRLGDWRVRDGRVECVNGQARWPLRTLHLLTRHVASEPGSLRLTVRTGPLDAGQPPGPGWRGFLLGAGGAHVDGRLTAQVHHRPAQDGGLLALVDDEGRVAFRDNEVGGGGGLWSVGGALADDEVPLIKRARVRGVGHPGFTVPAVDLSLVVEPADPGAELGTDPGTTVGAAVGAPVGATLTLSARDAASGALLSEAVLRDVPAARLDGGLALISHRGPAGSSAGSWFQSWSATGTALRADGLAAYGPVLAVQYTQSAGVLKLTAQLGPLGDQDTQEAVLELQDTFGRWRPVDKATIDRDSATASFRVPPGRRAWTADVPYRVAYDLATGPGATERHFYHGTIRAEPVDAEQFVIASLNCHKTYTGGLAWNHDGLWFPHGELVAAVAHHDPDLLFFAGDQIYEGDLDPAQRKPDDMARLDYLYKWFRWCWAFGELTRDRPTVTIPDDHDVYHGNLWGAGGIAAVADKAAGLTAQDAGGYRMPPRFVNMVHRTQTSHLPDPVDPAPVAQGISVYFTRLDYAGVSLAILADRQFKSSASVLVPDGQVVNGWFENDDFDPALEADVPGAVLLGSRQLSFLERWADDWSDGIWIKGVLSQSVFTNVATIPEQAGSGSVLPSVPIPEPDDDVQGFKLAADCDSNGWPQAGRNAALAILRRAFAFHLVGDQHLGSLVQYGIDEWRDAGFAFCSPAIANTWPRRWHPPVAGRHREDGAPAYTGDFTDGFGNLMTVWAVSNPVRSGREPTALYDRSPGYGIVRLSRAERSITFECWPRWIDPAAGETTQYAGWPKTVQQLDNRAEPLAWLPEIRVAGHDSAVFQVVDEATGTIESTWRSSTGRARLGVWGGGPYTVRFGEPGTDTWSSLAGLVPDDSHPGYHISRHWEW